MQSSEAFNLAEQLENHREHAEPATKQDIKKPDFLDLDSVIFESADFCALNIPERQSLLTPWLKEESITLLTGWRGTGKTWFAIGICDAVTTGEPFGPWKVEASHPCLYLEGEMAASDVKGRLLNLSSAERKAPFYIYSDAYANGQGMPRANLLNKKWRENMKRLLVSRGVKLWVVDNLASLSPGIDENAKKDWDPVNQWLLELRFLGITTILVHHTNKEGGQRGTSAREDNIDISLCLVRPADYFPEDGARFITKFTKARIATEDLPLIGDMEFRLGPGLNDTLIWSYKSVRGHNKTEILKLLDQGINQKEIAETLGVNKGYISRIKTQAIKDGYLSAKNRLTQAGLLHVNDI